MIKLLRPLIFFDLETTGTNTDKDRIVQLGFIRLEMGSERQGDYLINPGTSIPAAASAVHGITDADVEHAPSFRELSGKLLETFNGCDIAGFNQIKFDVPLLSAEFNRCSLSWPPTDTRYIDVCSIFQQKEQRTLSAAVQFYCGRPHVEAHGALPDVKATIDVFMRQMEIYELPDSVQQLHDISLNGKSLVDFAGKLSRDESGEIVYAIGKDKGLSVRKNPGFGTWMLSKDFPENTKMWIRQLTEQ